MVAQDVEQYNYMSSIERACSLKLNFLKLDGREMDLRSNSSISMRFLLRFISAMTPVLSNSLMAIKSISFSPFLSHQFPVIVNAPDSMYLS